MNEKDTPASRNPEESLVYLGELLMEAETVRQDEKGFRRFVAKKSKSRAKKRKEKKKR